MVFQVVTARENMIGMRVIRKAATVIRLPLFGIRLIDRMEVVYGESLFLACSPVASSLTFLTENP